jgi:MscS family membrane protein
LSDRPEGSLPFLTRPDQDLIGTISSKDGNVDIVVERVDRGKGDSLWLFSSKTLDAIPNLYAEVEAVAVKNFLPKFLVETRIAGIALFEWLALFVGIPLLYLFTAGLNRLLSLLAGRVRRFVSKTVDSSNPRLLPVPVRLLFMALAIRWVLSKGALPLLAREFWSGTAAIIAIASCVWMLIWMNGVGESFIRRRLVSRNQTGATSILRVGRRAMDFVILFAGVLTGLYLLGANLTATLAGLGVGGIAVALAAQKTLENVIGGISVIFDRAVRVGDQVKVGDNTGYVEEIGLRSTRIRTFPRTVVSVPNGQLSNVSLENISMRDKFWFHHIVSLRHQTSTATMRAILDGVNNLLAQHPSVERGSVRVRFLGFGTSSLDVELYAYVAASDFGRFLLIQQDLLLEVMEIVETAGTRLAYPSQTLYLARSNASGAANGDARLHPAATDPSAHLQDVR